MQETSPKEADLWLKNNEAYLIDVREMDEYQEWHIEGANLAPLSDLPHAINSLEIPTDKKIIVQCLKGGRSAQAIEFLSQNILRDHDVYNMAGGIMQWHKDGLPIVK